jgi:VanZ family protein
VPSVVWALTILVLCILPGDTFPDVDFWEIDWEDKVVHVGVFAALSGLMLWGEWRRTGIVNPGPKVKIIAVTLCLIFGFTTEIIQYQFIETRFGSISDVMADFAGAVIGALLTPYVLPKIKRFFPRIF